MKKLELEVLKKIIDEINHTLGSHISGIFAFGSKIRGDDHSESDFDVLLVVRKKTTDIQNRIISIFADFELEHNISFSPVIKDEKTFKKEKALNTPFYQNVINEGQKL